MMFLRYPRPDVPSIQKNQAKYRTITTDTARRKRVYSTIASRLDLLIRLSPIDTAWVPGHSSRSRWYNLDVWYGRKMGGSQRGGKIHYPEVTHHAEPHILIRAEYVLFVPQVRHPVSHYLLRSRLTGSNILPLTGPGVALSTHTGARVGTVQIMVESTAASQSLCVQASGSHETGIWLEGR
jgi:hypothetical protein